MTNPFLLSEIEKPQQPKQAEVNPYSMQAIETDQRQDLRNTLTGAVRQQPEHVAEAARLAKRYPAPVDVLARNLQDVKLQEAVDKYDETLKTSPKLQQYILDKPWETARLHKDIPQLSLLEQTFNVARSVPAGAVRGLGSVASGAGTLYDIAARQLAKPIIAIGGDAARDFLNTPIPQLLDPSATLLKRPGQSLKTIADVIGVDPANRNFATDVGEGIGQLVQQIAVQIATGGTASLVTLFSQGADTMATKTAKDAASQDAKDAAVLTGASITALTEKYGVDKLLNRVPPKIKNDALRWVADKLAAGGIEATQEIVEGVLQDVVRVALTNADAEIGDGALYEGGVAATSAAIVRAALGVRVRSNEQIERYDRAVEASNNLRQQLQAVQDIQARAHSPEVFREVVQGMADQTEGAPKSLWVDGEVLAQLPAEELATLPAEVQEQIADAAASSGFVEIPIGDIMLAEQGSVLEQTYVEYARETPDSPTLAEAQEAKALMESTLMQDAEGAIAQAQEQDTIRASSEVVRKAVLEQLNTTGAYRSSVNDALARVTAALFTTQAQRMNMTPEQAFQMSGFAVRGAGQQQGKGRVLNDEFNQAGQLVTDTPNFKNWFGNSKVVDERGAPLVVYHGTVSDVDAFDPNAQPYTYESDRGKQFFLDNPQGASDYAIGTSDAYGGNANVMPVYITMQNPRIEEVDGSPSEWWDEQGPLFWQIDVEGEGHDGAIIRGDGETMYVTGNPTQIKSVFNRGAFSPTDPNVLNQRGVQEKGKAVPTEVDATANVESAFEFAATESFATNRDFKLAIQARVVAAAKAAKVKLDEFTQGTEQYLVRMALADGLTALRTNANAIGWYNEKVTKALRLVSLIHPEIATDPQAKFAFVWAMAVTSNGLKVDKNFELAEKVYQGYKTTGQMPTDVGIGTAAEAINRSLGLYNTLIEKHGFDVVEKFMTTLQPAGEVEKFTGNKVTGENKTTLVYGAAALGPKIGNGFFMNLYGRFEQLTMDRWLMRTWGRWTGTLVEANPEQVKAKRTLIKGLIQSLMPADKKAFEAIIKRKLTVGDVDAVGQAIWKASQKPANRKAMAVIGVADETLQARFTELLGEPKKGQERVSVGDELRKAGNALTKYLDGQKEAPSGPPERGNIRKVFAQVLGELQKTYPALTMSDLQALLWYPEKRLYDAAKTSDEATDGYEDDEAPDYANAAAKLARSQGIPDADIAAASAAVDAELQAAVGAAGVQRGERGPGDRTGNQGDVNDRLEQAGDGAGRAVDAGSSPLPGAPVIAGATGPDPRLVAVAEQYARDNGIDLKRQSDYVRVDPELAARIAAAYEAMAHAPQDPAVKEAYENLIQQTTAQYRALEAAGYRFWFIDPTNDPYTSPFDAMREMRASQTLGVFPTVAGFGNTDTNPFPGNPMEADTGIQWPYGSPDGELRPVLANDLFRAVHDAFGHGLEGAGFRAQGEENAWQAHARLFTGSAVAAITTETRGQNSWLNFGPFGEQNQTAQVEDTVFADQKTGLLPEWAWSEGRAGDMQSDVLEQGPRGTYNPRNFEIVLNENANLSTYFHELSHFYLDFLGRMAEMPNASPEVVEDFNSFLNWTGVSQEQWREWRDFVIANPNKPLPKGMVKVHEALARAGEQYFLEGKAPSVELQPFMRRFARWMESVYTSLVNFIAGNPDKGLQLNADIRRFFDRALATDEQIAQAEQAAGMTPDDDATAEAKERLNKRSMAGFKWSVQMRDKIIADLRKQAKEIEDSIRQRVTEEVDEMPAMQARAALNQLMAASPEYKAELKAWDDARAAELARATEAVKEQLVAAEVARTNAPLEGLAKGRFLSQNRAEVENKAEAAALTWEKSNPKPRRITPDMTPQMESIADKYGYSSVDQMLQDIDAVGSRREMIDGLTEQRMLEEHGDLIDDRAIQQAANEAVHNDARARALAAELRTQQEMMGERTDTGRVNTKGRRITVNTLLAAARNFAANVVGRAKVMDLGNLSWKHNAAEARAGKRWQQLTAEGKTVEAVKAKQDQVIHNAAAKAALEAQAEIQKLLTYLKKFDKDSVRTKLPASYLDQIDKLLERVDLRVSTTRRDIDKRAALSKWIESQHALGLDPIVPDYLLDDAQLTSYKEMTVDQFRELTDTIKNIEHFGRLKSRLLAAKDKREFDAIATEIANEIIANKGTPLQVQLEPDGRTKKFFKGAWADHRKLNSLVRQMDGGKDNGPFYRALVRSMNEAGTKENVMLEQATEALAKIYAPIEALPGGFSGASVYIPEINASLSRAGRLAVALNWGNSTNRQRVMGGDNWTEAQVEAILATLSTTELEFVNNVWAQLDSYWPEMKAKQERVNGVVEDKVEAEPFELTAADGTVVQMRGGYYPIKYDSDRSLKSQKNEAQEVAADMLRGAILRPSTRRGHLKAREEEVNRPVRKDLSVITQHVNQVVHDLAWHEWLIDATRLLNDPRIAGAIRDYHGPEIHRAMTEAMRAIAEGDIAHQTEIDKLLLLMRANVTRSIMGASLTTALLQPFGLTQSMARIGVVPVLKGAWRWAGDGAQMQNSMKWIGEKSDFMRLRSKTFNRELREISQRVQGKSKFMQVADASLFFLMQKLQMVADVPTWIGAYEKALAGGVDEATAVQLADEAVLSSQGGGNTKDLAGVQRNLPFLTQFYSYFSTTLNLVAEKTALTDFKNPRAVAGWLGDMALLAVIPAILPALITYLLKGGGEDDEPEDWAKRLAEWQASYLLGMFVGLRELPAVWSPFDYQGPPAGKLINDGKRLVQQAGQGEIDDEAVLATIGFLGTALGIPTIQMTRSYKGWLAWDEGDAPVTSILFGPPPKD